MTSPIAYEKPKSWRLIALFALSIGAHIALAVLLIWVGKHLPGPPEKSEEIVDLAMDVQLGTEVQELVVAQNDPPTPDPPPPEPPPPTPPPPDPTPPPLEDPPEPKEMPEIVEPKPEPKATPAPKPKVVAKPAPAPPGAKVGPTPSPGVVGGNVAQGATTGTPGGKKIGTGWRTPRGPYPAAALARRITGNVRVKVSTNASGKVVSASTSGGDSVLQSAARQMALSIWSGPPNQTVVIPVDYRMP